MKIEKRRKIKKLVIFSNWWNNFIYILRKNYEFKDSYY